MMGSSLPLILVVLAALAVAGGERARQHTRRRHLPAGPQQPRVQAAEGGEGAEQYPIAWSPDGRYLRDGIVEAQGVPFAYADTQIDAAADHTDQPGDQLLWPQRPRRWVDGAAVNLHR